MKTGGDETCVWLFDALRLSNGNAGIGNTLKKKKCSNCGGNYSGSTYIQDIKE